MLNVKIDCVILFLVMHCMLFILNTRTYFNSLLFCLFVLLLCVPVNSYGHVRTVSSPSHTFFLGNLEQAVDQYFVHILSFVTDNNPS